MAHAFDAQRSNLTNPLSKEDHIELLSLVAFVCFFIASHEDGYEGQLTRL